MSTQVDRRGPSVLDAEIVEAWRSFFYDPMELGERKSKLAEFNRLVAVRDEAWRVVAALRRAAEEGEGENHGS
jgi:hypothetical protein